MRKLSLSVLSMLFASGLAIATPVVLLNFDGEKLKVKEGGQEITYRVTDKTVFKAGDKEVPREAVSKLLSNPKVAGKAKLDITTNGDKLIEVKLPVSKKKSN